MWRRRVVSGSSLRIGDSRQCRSCATRRLPYEEAVVHQLVLIYQKGAKRHNHNWDLTDDEARQLMMQPCLYCGKLPDEAPITAVKSGPFMFAYNGIDRQDNSAGYTPENAVPCCAPCNRAKKDMGLHDFLTWIARVRNGNKRRKVADDLMPEGVPMLWDLHPTVRGADLIQ
jgi:hypothetical protein